jgi:hypothetical protein
MNYSKITQGATTYPFRFNGEVNHLLASSALTTLKLTNPLGWSISSLEFCVTYLWHWLHDNDGLGISYLDYGYMLWQAIYLLEVHWMNAMSKNFLKTLTMCRCSLVTYSQQMAQLEVLFQLEKRSTLKFKVGHVPCLFYENIGHELVGRIQEYILMTKGYS